MQVQMSVLPMLHAQVSVAATLTIQRPVSYVQVSTVVPTKSDSDVIRGVIRKFAEKCY